MGLEIFFEDKYLIVVAKPAGLPVQTSNLRTMDLVSMLKNHRVQNGEEPYIGLIHRLDQPVEGVMVFAKDKRTAAGLSSQIKERQVEKMYQAVVTVADEDHAPLTSGGKLTDYLLHDTKNNTSSVTHKETAGARQAMLEYEVLGENGDLRLLSVRLLTGRHHQIRVQLAHAGWPIVGDQKYGNQETVRRAGSGKNVALCSVKIGFIHPVSGKEMEFVMRPDNPTFLLLTNSATGA